MKRLLFFAALTIVVFSFIPGLVTNWLEREGYQAPSDDRHIAAVKREKSGDIRNTGAGRSGRVVLKPNANGHHFTQAFINNKSVRVLIDTGASNLALRYEDAKRLGVKPQKADFTARVRTGAGIIHYAPVTIRSVRVGPLEQRNIDALVAPPNSLGVTLLGMSYLKRLKRFEMQQGKLILEN